MSLLPNADGYKHIFKLPLRDLYIVWVLSTGMVMSILRHLLGIMGITLRAYLIKPSAWREAILAAFAKIGSKA